MTTPRKLAQQRRRKQAQQETIQNLQRGAQEVQTAAQQNPGLPANPDDPDGLIAAGSASVRITSAPGVEPTNSIKPARVATRKRRQASSVKIVTDRSRRNASTKVISEQRDPTGRQTSYGGGRVVEDSPSPRLQAKPAPQQFQTVQPQPTVPTPTGPVVRHVPTEVDVTVILTCFERPNMLRHQLTALKAQTFMPKHIVVWVNAGAIGHDETALSGRDLQVIRANVNYGPWVRFTMASEIASQNQSKYLCILDDDTVPGPKWIQACVERLEQAEANPEESTYCIAAAGEIFRSDDPNDRISIGPERQGPDEHDVDVGRQGWFFPTRLLEAFQSHPRLGDGRIGWGLHFSAALQKAGVFTLVLPYEHGNHDRWGITTDVSVERSLSSLLGVELPQLRADVYHAYREFGWMPLFVLDQEPQEDEEDEVDGGGVEEGSAASAPAS